MKQITMDYEIYSDDLAQANCDGYHEGIHQVMLWLESGKPLKEFLGCDHEITRDGHWGRLLKALNREHELEDFKKPKKEKKK